MLSLLNGCRCSYPTIFPANYKSGGLSLLKKVWRITYRFYDPKHLNHPRNGKPIVVKAGINRYNTLEERRKSIEDAHKQLLELLQVYGYNPLTGTTHKQIDAIAHTNDPEYSNLKEGLNYALKNCNHAASTTADLKTISKRAVDVAASLGLDKEPIRDLTRRDIIAILNICARKKDGEFSNYAFNRFRTYLSLLFSKLEELEILEANPILLIKKKKTVKKIRKVLSDKERAQVDTYLKETFPQFHRFLHMFYHSGAREEEIMKLQRKHVDLDRKVVTYTILKGGEPHEVERPIKDIVVWLWQAQCEGAKANDYLFAKGLVPGPERIRTDQIRKRWYKFVKQRLGITADFYSLKHLHSTEAAEMIGEAQAAKHNAHSEEILKSAYDVRGKARKDNAMRKLRNGFAPE